MYVKHTHYSSLLTDTNTWQIQLDDNNEVCAVTSVPLPFRAFLRHINCGNALSYKLEEGMASSHCNEVCAVTSVPLLFPAFLGHLNCGNALSSKLGEGMASSHCTLTSVCDVNSLSFLSLLLFYPVTSNIRH